MFAIAKGHGGGGSVMCVIRGVAQVCLLAVVLCESPATVHFRCLLLVGLCYGLCVLSILRIRGDLCVQSV
jgi:hypothetical protein